MTAYNSGYAGRICGQQEAATRSSGSMPNRSLSNADFANTEETGTKLPTLVRNSMRTTCALLVVAFVMSGAAQADSRNLAPGFSKLAKGAKILVMPPDVELFSISAGGVSEPKADWTEAAH
ncbi:MAG: hypothetical protein Q7U97_02135, partial [Rhodocyclaceae bacterium]|nr:hypothetical protein [Rhodocyclaceae bacterium]